MLASLVMTFSRGFRLCGRVSDPKEGLEAGRADKDTGGQAPVQIEAHVQPPHVHAATRHRPVEPRGREHHDHVEEPTDSRQ
jgi:hypothetical protein